MAHIGFTTEGTDHGTMIMCLLRSMKTDVACPQPS